jgi:transketolase
MAAIANGMALHGGVRPFVATFLVFADYLRPALRLAALMGQPVVYVFTHDSIGLGGDGPTHQPIETLASLRAIPNLVVFRPADANETARRGAAALERTRRPDRAGPHAPDVPHLDVPAGAVARGGYVLAGEDEDADVLLIATGSEVALALAAREPPRRRGRAGARRQPALASASRPRTPAYRDAVLPRRCARAWPSRPAATFGWERYVGDDGEVVGIDRFGASAPGDADARSSASRPRRASAEAARRTLADGGTAEPARA